jgi:hypothetical protein
LLKFVVSAKRGLQPELASESRLEQVVHREHSEDDFENIPKQQDMKIFW